MSLSKPIAPVDHLELALKARPLVSHKEYIGTRESLDELGFGYVAPDAFMKQWGTEVGAIIEAIANEKKNKPIPLTGNVDQFVQLKADPRYVYHQGNTSEVLPSGLKSRLQTYFDKHIIPKFKLSPDLKLLGSKGLRAKPKTGGQSEHMDGAADSESISVIIYCSAAPGQTTTAVPIFPVKHLPLPQHLDNPSDAEKAKMAAASHLLHPRFFHSIDAEVGGIMLLRQSTPHYGTLNNSLVDRLVVFDVLSKVPFAANPHQDEYQFFCWMYVGLAHGFNTPEYVHALLEAEEHTPLGHYLPGEGYEAAQGALHWAIEKLQRMKLSAAARPVRTVSQTNAASAKTASAPPTPTKLAVAAAAKAAVEANAARRRGPSSPSLGPTEK